MERELEANAPSCSLSFIYYPSTSLDVDAGHAELEVEGESWNFIDSCSKKSLRNMINKATQDGFPFVRFVLKAEPNQICKIQGIIKGPGQGIIKENVPEYSCSRGALAPLAEAGVCMVPLPFNISPLLSAAYLIAGRGLRLNNVQKIEYYGNPYMHENIKKMIPGVVGEVVLIGAAVFTSWVTMEVAKQVANEDS